MIRALAVTALLAASAVPAAAAQRGPVPTASKISHVVIVVQENRSFDDLFQGYPGADTVSSGRNSKGLTVPLAPISLAATYDIDHKLKSFMEAYDNGKMDGFDLEYVCCIGAGAVQPNPQYGYVPPAESKPYFAMASQYVLADRMFASQIDGSFVSHQYIIGGYASHTVDLPTTLWGCGGNAQDVVPTLTQARTYGPFVPPCFDNRTLADELDAKGLPWRFYATTLSGSGGIWSAYQAISHIYGGPDWKADVVTPPSRFLSDMKAGRLAAVTWITPTLQDSDHSGVRSARGPMWVSSLVDAVGTSPFWNSTAIFIMWDDWGGWYDHVPPPYVDYDGLGLRVPLLIVSPYAKQGYVSHVQYEHGSILRFVEDVFGLGRLAASDTRANSPEADAFDFTKAPRPFKPFASLPESTFSRENAGGAPDAQ